ncbi:MAG: efflux RND transporter periplasmic adaptor subunit [Planctomycetota bacterium]
MHVFLHPTGRGLGRKGRGAGGLLRTVRRALGTAALAALLGTTASCGKEAPAVQAAPPPAKVTAVVVEARDTPITHEFVGKTASSRRVEIRSRVEGFLDKRSYVEGEMVKKGDVLFQVDPRPFQAQVDAAKAALAQQEARLFTTERNLSRIRPLVERKAVAQKDLDDAEGLYRAAQAAVEGAKAIVVQAELELGYTTIHSPLSGLSSYALKREGAYLGFGAQSLLTYIAQIDPMWVEFSVSENQILDLRAQAEKGRIVPPKNGDYVVRIVLANGTRYPEEGKITFADASLSEKTGTFLLRAEIENPERLLRPGQFVHVKLGGAIRPEAILIPQRAVLQGAKGSFVWVVDDTDKVELRPVTLGPWRGQDWIIDGGLEDGETVVVDGGQKLRAGQHVEIVQERPTRRSHRKRRSESGRTDESAEPADR